MANTNEQDIICYESDKKLDSIDSSPNNYYKFQKNNITTKHLLLGQIKEKEQKYEQDQDNNSNNEVFSHIEKINANHLINDVDKLYKQHINNQRNIKIFNSKSMEEYYKMNKYIIDIESKNKIIGDYNINNTFENGNEEYQNDSKNENNKNSYENNESLNNYKRKNFNEKNNNKDLFQIEINQLINGGDKKFNDVNENEFNSLNNLKKIINLLKKIKINLSIVFTITKENFLTKIILQLKTNNLKTFLIV